MKTVSGKAFARLLEKKGWALQRTKGSHHIYVKEGTNVRISVPIHGTKPLKIGLIKHFMSDSIESCIMASEERARRIVQKALGKSVAINDDGSASGMYDLRVGPRDAPEIAIECVGAVDQAFTETWNVGPAKGPLKLSISGDWIITINANSRVKMLDHHIESLLQELESRGMKDLFLNYQLKRDDEELFNKLESLGITGALCCSLHGTGVVNLTMPGRGGPVDEHGLAVPKWVGEFLRAPKCRDVLSKLQRSGATARHAFLIVAPEGAPWSVEAYLMRDINYVPRQAPDLPQPVTGVWIVSGMGRGGLRWDRNTWQLFDACGKGIDD